VHDGWSGSPTSACAGGNILICHVMHVALEFGTHGDMISSSSRGTPRGSLQRAHGPLKEGGLPLTEPMN
jgi:hypothetical protein